VYQQTRVVSVLGFGARVAELTAEEKRGIVRPVKL
jgi:hypothetical protein